MSEASERLKRDRKKIVEGVVAALGRQNGLVSKAAKSQTEGEGLQEIIDGIVAAFENPGGTALYTDINQTDESEEVIILDDDEMLLLQNFRVSRERDKERLSWSAALHARFAKSLRERPCRLN